MEAKSTLTGQHGAPSRSRRPGVSTVRRLTILNSRHRFVSGAIVLFLAGLALTPLALARVVANTIDPIAIVTDNGRLVIATGPLTCTRAEQAFLRITVTQRPTGAVAEGHGRLVCTGNNQQWQVQAATQGHETFGEGPAVAVAIARTADRGEITDAHQWLVNVTLVGE